MVRLSTGLALSLLGLYGLRAMMNYGHIKVYTGEQPLSPDMPPEGEQVAYITTDGLAFAVGSSSGGALEVVQDSAGVIQSGGTWQLTGIDTGTAGWWRWYWNAYDGEDHSFFYPRMDGLVGESLVLANVNITAASYVEINAFNVQFRG